MLQIFGDIQNPLEAINPSENYGSYEQGLPGFIGNILKLITILAGLWSLINIVLAGFNFVTAAGNPEEIKKAAPKIWNSIIGLLIIVASFIIVAIVGWIFFGDPDIILKPVIFGPGVL